MSTSITNTNSKVETQPQTIPNPRRILIVGPAHSGKLTLLKILTGGSLPPIPDTGTHAGLSHILELKTPYYLAQVPVWVDEIPLPTTSSSSSAAGEVVDAGENNRETTPTLEEWTNSYLSADAAGVLEAIAAIIYTFRGSKIKLQEKTKREGIGMHLQALKQIADSCEDVICLGVAVDAEVGIGGGGGGCGGCGGCGGIDGGSGFGGGGLEQEEEEEEEETDGWEIVYLKSKKGRNIFGELMGVGRVFEVLHSASWESGTRESFDDEGNLYEDGKEEDVDGTDSLAEPEDFGSLRIALVDRDEMEGGAEEVEQMEAVMRRLLMVREMRDSLSKEERRKLAAKTVADIMK